MTEDDTAGRTLREAADWLAMLNARHVDQETLDAFFAWRRLPGHAEAYEEVERVWAETERLGGDRDIAIAVRDALARPRWQRRWMALEGGIRQRPIVTVMASLCLLLLVVGGTVFSMQGDAYATATGEQRLVQLADGSSVRLDTATRLRVRLTRGLRRVDLIAGQALFAVAHDKERPFVVHAGDAEITAVGTRFDVSAITDKPVSVALVEGRLALTGAHSKDSPVALEAGRGADFDGSDWSRPTPIDAQAATSWTSGRLTFADTPLAAAIGAMNRYSVHKLILADTALAETEVSGNFDTADVRGFITALGALYHLKATDQPDGTVLLSR